MNKIKQMRAQLEHSTFGYHWIWIIPLVYVIICIDKLITFVRKGFGVGNE
jgi:hypothetical protein